MEFERFVCGPLANNVFLVFGKNSKKAAIIDPALGSNVAVLRAKELGLKVELILNTHGHPDHTIEDEFIKEQTGAKLFIHKLDEFRLAQNSKMVTPYLQVEHAKVIAEHTFLDGQIIKIGEIELEVIHTPGHTEGSSCFFEQKSKTLFSGDTLFKQTFGRVDFDGGNAELMKQSLKKLYSTLPKETLVLPGHGEFTEVGKEKWIEEI